MLIRSTGRGLFLQDSRPKGSFLVEYYGELIDAAEGYRREQLGDNSVSAIFCDTERKTGGMFLVTACIFACVDACLSVE